jgi:hypothetical protein
VKIDNNEFSSRFRDALMAASSAAPHKNGATLDQIELHFHGVQECTFDEACSQLFIADDRFFKVIDVSVHPKRDCWFFVRPSGHDPGSWDETADFGEHRPFNIMVPE